MSKEHTIFIHILTKKIRKKEKKEKKQIRKGNIAGTGSQE